MSDNGLGRGEGDVGVATVAMALRVSVRQVQRMTRAGMPGRIAPGRYDLGAVVRWFINREVEKRLHPGADARLIERLRQGIDARDVGSLEA